MIEYIYFVKCPNCEDEHFDMFDDAKTFACGRLSDKPVITQVEVNRNDFGECTDSTDLGTVWSWEDMMVDIPEETTFSKADTLADDVDYFNEFDDMLDDVPDNFCMPVHEAADPECLATNKRGDYLVAADSGKGYTVFNANKVCLGGIDCEDEKTAIDRFNRGDLDENLAECSNKTGKSIPEGMTVEDLVHEMEMNEDDVECTWCNELYDKSECRYEVDLGWLCSSCEAAIKSRGETLTFREGSYWDFLDEDTNEDALTEAIRVAKLVAIPDAKEQIITAAEQALGDRARHVIANGTILPTHIQLTGNYGSSTDHYIVDFSIEGENIIVNVERRDAVRNQPTRVTPYAVELQELMGGWKWSQYQNRGLARNSAAYRLLKAIRDAAVELNRTVDLVAARDARVSATLTDEVANEFRDHTVNIKFAIPLQEYSAGDFSSEMDGFTEELAQRAAANLDKIRERFLEWEYADQAIDAGMVHDRSIYNRRGEYVNRLYEYATSWKASGKIAFDCEVCNLSQEAQNVVISSQVNGNWETTRSSKEIDCIRLAMALINYFRDVKFYEHHTAPTAPTAPMALAASYSADHSHLDSLEEAADYRARLVTCNECKSNSLDEETGICINCGAMVSEVEDAETLNEGVMMPLELMMRTGKEAFFELEKFVTDAVEDCKKYRDSGNYDVHSIEMPYKQGFRDKAVRQAVIDALAKEGFPGGQMVSYDDSLIYVPLTKAANGYGDMMSKRYGNGNFDNPTARGNKLAHADQAITQPNMQPKNNPHAAGRELAHRDEAITEELLDREHLSWYIKEDRIDELEELIDKAIEDCKKDKADGYDVHSLGISHKDIKKRELIEHIIARLAAAGFDGAFESDRTYEWIYVPLTDKAKALGKELMPLYKRKDVVYDAFRSTNMQFALRIPKSTKSSLPPDDLIAAGRRLAHNDQAINQRASAIDYGRNSLITPKTLY